MLTGTHRNPRQEEVIYGRPAADVVVETAEAHGAVRIMIVPHRNPEGSWNSQRRNSATCLTNASLASSCLLPPVS